MGTSEAEISVSGKAECSLAIGEKKSKLCGVTFKTVLNNQESSLSDPSCVSGVISEIQFPTCNFSS